MDFGDILNQWDEQQRDAPKKKLAAQKQGSGKRANARTAEERAADKARAGARGAADAQMERDAAQTINPMELWLRRYGTVDKDAAAEEYRERTKMEHISYLRNMRPEARLDLHGLTRDEAWARLTSFVADCVRRGLKKILIVHGKGNHSRGSDPVLGPLVRTFIEQHEHLGTSGHPDYTQGGTGATWVIIK